METENGVLSCTARGKLRTEGQTPLVGDRVKVTALNGGKGSLEEILPRKNAFIRPAVANLDVLVILASAVIPVTEPFFDRQDDRHCRIERLPPRRMLPQMRHGPCAGHGAGL